MKKRLSSLFIVFLIATVVLVGCGNDDGDISKDEGKEPTEDVAEKEDDKEEVEQEDNWFEDMETTDLDGEEIDESIFTENDLTLINTWATWCGPCVAEIEDLGKLAKELDGVGIKGLLVEIDQNDGDMLAGVSGEEKEVAEDILNKSNADYQQILVWEGLKETDFEMISAFPTSYFVDSEGKFVGAPVEGARTADQWKEIINERLEMVEND